ncbi:MAG: hypothetical protein HFI63_09720 [Lachnospiraceae bacterium]|nr:hypothetical protein [Lachnospiraceae bacterium]
MLKTLRLSFTLRNTYRVNGILYAIKQIPLLKRIIPPSVYQIHGFKIFANILSVIWEVVTIFLGKLLYFLLMILGVGNLYHLPVGTESQAFLHLLFFLSIAGMVINTYMFNPTKDKYYAMILLGMNAREYTLVNYFYAILKVLAGFTLCGFLFGSPRGCSLWQCLLIPFFVAGLKLMTAAYALWDYEKKKTVRNENSLTKYMWGIVAVCLAMAYGLPAFAILVPETVVTGIMCLSAIFGILSLHKILTFRDYRLMYKEMLTSIPLSGIQVDGKVTAKIQQEQSLKNISADQTITSNRKGFEYLNELFIKRHRKILWRSARRLALLATVLTAGCLAAFRFIPELRTGVNGKLMTSLPYFVIVMYFINRGTGFTSALFINCDHSLLTYSFYKQPKFILKLFQIRLREIIKVNLLPAAVIGMGLVILLYASGGTKTPLDYAVLLVSIICMSIFFSVHYLTLYYLLQPYNAGTEIKSGTYQVILTLTYLASYVMIYLKLPILLFGIMTIVFCILYSIGASILVYRFAPKTFRIRL